MAALARHLGVDWHTCWDTIETEAIRRLDDPGRLTRVVTLGIDEHIWKPSHHGGGRAVTSMVDLTRDQAGHVRARLLNAFHVVKLGTTVIDETHHRVQQDTLGHRGHKDDPLYKIRGLLHHGAQHLSARQGAHLEAAPDVGNPDELFWLWTLVTPVRSREAGGQSPMAV